MIILWMGTIKSDVDSYFEDIRSKVENLRDWGEQWKALAKDLFNELLEIDSDNTIDSYLSYKALDKIINMNKRKTKKRLHLNNKEFQILFRSGKKYFRYAINNLCLAFGCSSLEY